MQAVTLNCPTCGAAATAGDAACAFCRARLATVGCPSCFGLVFVGSRHCAHCGARAAQPDASGDVPLPCPRGCGPLSRQEIGDVPLAECQGCGGVWLDEHTFQRLCKDEERQAVVLTRAGAMPRVSSAVPAAIRYLPCASCGTMMHRVNFARASGIIIDCCRKHGAWFDADELRRVVEFVRAGGLDWARDREREALAHERRRLEMTNATVGAQRVAHANGHAHDVSAGGLAAAFASLFTS